jgi:hypothetical protein
MGTGFALVRQQADALRSMGRYRDAQDLYGRFVLSAARIDPAVRAVIEADLKLIESEIAARPSGEGPGRPVVPAVPADPGVEHVALPPARQRAAETGIRRHPHAAAWLIGIAVTALLAAFLAQRFFATSGDRHAPPPAAESAAVVTNKMPPEPATGDVRSGYRPEAPAGRRIEPESGAGEVRAHGESAGAGDARIGSPPQEADAPPAADHAQSPAVANRDAASRPAEPDPAAAIDFVIQKRRPGL